MASFRTRDFRSTWGLSSDLLKIDWLVDADPAGEFDALCFDIEVYCFVNHFPWFETIGVTCVFMVFFACGMILFKILLHFRAAFTRGEEVGVTFPSNWGA